MVTLDAAAGQELPPEYRELLESLGYGDIHFPTNEGPVRFSVLSPDESVSTKSNLVAFLARFGVAAAISFLVDAGGGMLRTSSLLTSSIQPRAHPFRGK